jgi:ribulose-phosphate 3-epimerase
MKNIKTLVVPSVFATDSDEFEERLGLALVLSKNVHIDIMDGLFVPSVSMPIGDIESFANGEVHLMVNSPEEYVKTLSERKCKRVMFHYESNPSKVSETAALIKLHKMEPFLAIGPKTAINSILEFEPVVKGFLLMGIAQGAEHQKMIPATFDRLKQLREKTKLPIAVDGGVNPQTADKLAKLGANEIISGSYVAGSKDHKVAFKELQEAVR